MTGAALVEGRLGIGSYGTVDARFLQSIAVVAAVDTCFPRKTKTMSHSRSC